MDDLKKIKEISKIHNVITGRNVFPKNTDITKTYQYRYALKFLKQMEGVSWNTIKKIAELAFEYAVQNDGTMLSRGLWILTKSDIVDIAYNKIQQDSENFELELEKIEKSYKFAKDNNFNFGYSQDGSFPNIIKWFENGNLCLSYIALSKSCNKIISSIDSTDKSMLPIKELESRRIRYLLEDNKLIKIRKILQNDFLNLIR